MSATAIARATLARGGGAVTGVGNARRQWSERGGIVLSLVAANGDTGQGEASPLPDYSPDTLDQAGADLEDFASRTPTIAFDPDKSVRQQIERATGSASPAAPRAVRSAAARFAIESALLDLCGVHRGQPVAELLNPGLTAKQALFACAFAGQVDERIGDAVRAARERGYRAAKIKLGGAPPGDSGAWARERDLVREAADAAGDMRLRADVNGAWPLATARSRLRELRDLNFEFVEQPVAPADMPTLLGSVADASAVPPIAVDESLHSASDDVAETLFAAPACRYAVLKPMVLGGLFRCLDLAAIARRHGVEPVPSHLFDGPIAMAAYCSLALALAPACAVGLSQHAGLTAWPGSIPCHLQQAAIVALDRPGLGHRATRGGTQ